MNECSTVLLFIATRDYLVDPLSLCFPVIPPHAPKDLFLTVLSSLKDPAMCFCEDFVSYVCYGSDTQVSEFSFPLSILPGFWL